MEENLHLSKLGGNEMTLTVRERFIQHVTALMVLDNNGLLGDKDLFSLVNSMLESRCRELTDEQVEQLFSDMDNEVEICIKNHDLNKENLEGMR